jgi:hypothetical protein
MAPAMKPTPTPPTSATHGRASAHSPNEIAARPPNTPASSGRSPTRTSSFAMTDARFREVMPFRPGPGLGGGRGAALGAAVGGGSQGPFASSGSGPGPTPLARRAGDRSPSRRLGRGTGAVSPPSGALARRGRRGQYALRDCSRAPSFAPQAGARTSPGQHAGACPSRAPAPRSPGVCGSATLNLPHVHLVPGGHHRDGKQLPLVLFETCHVRSDMCSPLRRAARRGVSSSTRNPQSKDPRPNPFPEVPGEGAGVPCDFPGRRSHAIVLQCCRRLKTT